MNYESIFSKYMNIKKIPDGMKETTLMNKIEFVRAAKEIRNNVLEEAALECEKEALKIREIIKKAKEDNIASSETLDMLRCEADAKIISAGKIRLLKEVYICL